MKNTDTFEQKIVLYILDKPYNLIFTMKAIYALEKIYGSTREALDKLYGDDELTTVIAVTDFLHALLGLEKSYIGEYLTIDKLIDAQIKIHEALLISFPDSKEDDSPCSPYEPSNWDNIYYTMRYRLKMSDEEIWGCTPRRYDKLYYLWLYEHDMVKEKPRQVFIDEVSI